MLVLAGDKEFPVGGDHVAGHEAVDGESEAAHEVADAAAQGQPADAGVGDDAAGHGQPERLGLVVDVAPEAAALCPGGASQRVQPHAGHRQTGRSRGRRRTGRAQPRRAHRLESPPAAPAPGRTAPRPRRRRHPCSGRCRRAAAGCPRSRSLGPSRSASSPGSSTSPRNPSISITPSFSDAPVGRWWAMRRSAEKCNV